MTHGILARAAWTLSLALAAAAAQAQPAGERRPPDPPSASELQRELGLDTDKAEQVATLMARHAEARRQLHEHQRGELEAMLTLEQRHRFKARLRIPGGRDGRGTERQP